MPIVPPPAADPLRPPGAGADAEAARVILETITVLLERINAISDAGPGWTRPSYSALESKAHCVIEDAARDLGLLVNRDPAGNFFARMKGSDPNRPPLFIGSHLDTVSHGGAFDGQAGVVAAMALLAALSAKGLTPTMDVVLAITRAEESVWFPVSYIGSRAHLGELLPEDMAARRSDTGRSLADHMREQGFDPDAVLAIRAPAAAQFLEFHIEQGPVLAGAGEAYALVRAVHGGLRYRQARITGQWAHSGGAPRDARADAVVAFSDLVMSMDRIWAAMLAQGCDLTVTFGRVDAATPAHAMAKVAGDLGFCLDLRSEDVGVLERVDALLHAEIARVQSDRPGIAFALGSQSRSAPARMSEALLSRLETGAALLGDHPRLMLSGGGHDAAAYANAGWDSAMIFIRNENGSHCPEEGMEIADLSRAVLAVYTAIAGGWAP